MDHINIFEWTNPLKRLKVFDSFGVLSCPLWRKQAEKNVHSHLPVLQELVTVATSKKSLSLIDTMAGSGVFIVCFHSLESESDVLCLPNICFFSLNLLLRLSSSALSCLLVLNDLFCPSLSHWELPPHVFHSVINQKGKVHHHHHLLQVLAACLGIYMRILQHSVKWMWPISELLLLPSPGNSLSDHCILLL